MNRCIQGLHAPPLKLRVAPRSQPIAEWASYLGLQALSGNGLSINQIDAVVIQHRRLDILRATFKEWANVIKLKKVVEPINVPRDPYHIFVHTKVLKKSGKVKVTIDCPMGKHYDQYRDTSTPPPTLGDRLIAAKRFGYPEYVLENIIKADDRWYKRLPDMEKMIIRVFGEGKSKPPTAAALAKAKKVASAARMKKFKGKSRMLVVNGVDEEL